MITDAINLGPQLKPLEESRGKRAPWLGQGKGGSSEGFIEEAAFKLGLQGLTLWRCGRRICQTENNRGKSKK